MKQVELATGQPLFTKRNGSFSDLYTKFVDSTKAVKKSSNSITGVSLLARSRSLRLMHKNPPATAGIWQGVHRIQDIQPSQTIEEHDCRILTRESTPWVYQEKPLVNLTSKYKLKRSTKI
jgi:hypothetical protein